MRDRSFDISTFKKVEEDMVAKNGTAWDSRWSISAHVQRLRDYKPEQIISIINGSSLTEQQVLSRNYYDKNGFYKRILLHYATLLKYASLLIPHPSFGKQLSDPYMAKKYYAALDYIEKLNLPEVLTRMSLCALINGSYYGLIQTLNKDNLVIIDLPSGYCCSRFKDLKGNDIVEFNVEYFNSIVDEVSRESALASYPDIISKYYRKWMKGKKITPWVKLPANIGVCFPFFDDGRPLFLEVIPATIQYDDAVDTERERELEEIRKIIVQKVPHLADGQLVFEPEEALEMHRGAVDMMRPNKNISVLTTYADVDAIISKSTSDNVSSTLDKMLQNVYAEAGVSGQIFSPTGTQALPYSLKNDLALMMILGNKYSRFFTHIINLLFSNANIHFSFKILPISYYNDSDYIKDAFKLAQSGFSFLLPAIAAGLDQREIVNIKDLENNVLGLKDILIPLSSAYTQSSNDVGAPPKNLEDKAEKTIQNEDAIDHQGGSE
jgi:hypothetical protein